MKSKECGILQMLISDLDDTRFLYTELGPLLAHPRLIYLVGLITVLHEQIAEDLARQMDTPGAQAPHRGESVLGKLRGYLELLLAITGVNVDLGCLKVVTRHEPRVVQRFARTLNEVQGLPQYIYREHCHLAYALYRIESLMPEMKVPRLTLARTNHQKEKS